MSYEIVQRALITHTNEQLINEDVDFTYQNLGGPIITDTIDYNMRVENAIVDLYGMVIDPKPSYSICLFVNDKDLATSSGLNYGPNYYKISGTIMYYTDFLKWLISVFEIPKIPIVDWGFVLKDEFLTYSVTINQYNEYFAINGSDHKLQVYFNQSFSKIFREFADFTANGTELAGSTDNLWYPFITNFNATSSFPITISQSLSTIQRLLKARKLEFFTSLPVTQFFVQKTELNSITRSNIMATAIINRETFNIVEKGDLIYIPQVPHDCTFTRNEEVNLFTVQVRIVYDDESTQVLTIPPESYFSLVLAFFKLKK